MFTTWRHLKFLFLIIHGLTFVEFCLSSTNSTNRVENCISESQNCSSVDGKVICYRPCSYNQLSWNDAQRICSNYNSTLPVIRNRKEQESLESYLKSHAGISGGVWTSGRKVTHGQWTWLNGQPYGEEVLSEDGSTDSYYQTHAALTREQKFKKEDPLHSLWYMCQYRGNACNIKESLKLTNSCVVLSASDTSWYAARSFCLDREGDLAVLSNEDLQILKNHSTTFINPGYWIGLEKNSWQWKFLDNKSEDVKYSKWRRVQFPLDSDPCISIQASNGEWRASKCEDHSNSVICQNERNIFPGATSTSPTPFFAPTAPSSSANNPSESTSEVQIITLARNMSTRATPISTSTIAQTTPSSSTLSSIVRESTFGATPTSETSTLGLEVSSRSVNNSAESTDVTTRLEPTVNNPATVVYAMIGVGVLLIFVCIIFIFLLVRRRQKEAKEIRSSKVNTMQSNNGSDLEEESTKKTPEITTSSVHKPQGAYAEISPAKNSNMDLENAPINPHPPSGTVYASVEFQKDATYAEPVKI